MNKTKQFWVLFKFQTMVNPALWFLPFAFGIPLFLPYLTGVLSKAYHPSFTSLFMNQNLMFVAIFGSMILAPEKFQFGVRNLASSYYGTEFLLTRAIDRPVLYRAKAAVLYLLILSLPFIAVLHSLKDPDLVVREFSKPVQEACLASVPGSTLLPSEWKKSPPSLISIPRGNVMATEWQFGILAIAAITLQLFILILYPFKYAKPFFWVLYVGIILVPLFDLTHLGKDEPTVTEQLFFSFAGQPVHFWILTALAFVFTQLWCERRFARLEQ